MAQVLRNEQRAKISKSSARRPTDEKQVPKPRSFLRRNSLSIACLVLFLVFWAGQAVTGWHVYNTDATTHEQEAVSFATYLRTGHFFEATFENWESEFLQMFGFILLTAWFVQRGSAESKKEQEDPTDEDPWQHQHDPDAPWPVRRGGLWLKLYENSLLLAFISLFLFTIVGHAISGTAEFNSEQVAHGEEAVSLLQFASSSDFWFQSFQNWQSEFLAVFSIVVLSIFLRQKGSPESKPVHAPTSQTGE
jgi:hypothetical protein